MKLRFTLSTLGIFVLSGIVFASLIVPVSTHAIQNPQSGSVGLEGTISTDPPKQGASITTPGSGASFTSTPITINGLCPKGLLVKLFANNVFIGSVSCDTGSYSLQTDLFSGQNDLVARVYDALDQAGPDSNIVTVNFVDAKFAQFNTRIALSSPYATRGAAPGEDLTWPITLSGGIGPYALSVDWGDGSAPDLLSQSFAGNITIKHKYKAAGVYKMIIKATDSTGSSAFLQLVGVATGKIAVGSGASGSNGGSSGNGSSGTIRTKVIWWPAVVLLPLIIATFWVGRRHELYTLRKQLEKTRNQA
jgi:hypothetical protein